MVRIPTPELVELACKKFDLDNKVDERALTELFRRFPSNTDAAQVLLKVVAVNSIYATNLFAFRMAATHIHAVGKELDERIDAGDLTAFDLIEHIDLGGDKPRWCFSFASKYLSWQKPAFYPIYDSRVDHYLRAVIKQDQLPYKPSSWEKYHCFRDTIDGLRNTYGLQQFTYKQLDAFFYEEGARETSAKGAPPY